MWTLDTRVELTPAGRYVEGLRREDKRLEELQFPGKDCPDPRVTRIAVKAEAIADNLRGSLRDELARCGALPLGPEPELAGVSCDQCGRHTTDFHTVTDGNKSDCELYVCRTCAEWPDDYDRPDCLTCGDRGSIPVGAAGNSEIETTCPDCGPDYR